MSQVDWRKNDQGKWDILCSWWSWSLSTLCHQGV